MNDIPILFNAEVARAILARTKTQTRLPLKLPQPQIAGSYIIAGDKLQWCEKSDLERMIGPPPEWHTLKLPFGAPGDRLWVRETTWECVDNNDCLRYVADGPAPTTERRHYRKRSSSQMPREASRITLAVKRVWIEHVQDISEEDAIAEGVDAIPSAPAALTHRTAFRGLWDSIYTKPGLRWDDKPLVAACEFELIEQKASNP